MNEYSKSNLNICVVMLTYNQRERTLEVLSNLKTIKDPPFDILVWDNGSSDSTVDAVRAGFPDVIVHQHHENLGVAPGRNAAAHLAIKTLNPTHLLFLDNDMFVEPEFVGALYKPFTEDKKIGQTQAKLRFMDDRQRLNDGGGCEITYWLGRTRPVGFGEIDEGQYDTQKECVACGGAMMVRREVFQELGGFDEIYGVLGPDDLDFSLRLAKAGYTALYVPEAVAYHRISHTYGGDYHENYARLKAYNWFIFIKRHASLPQRFAFYLFGSPYLILRILIREGRRGNLAAVRGILRGALGYMRSK